MDRQTNGFICNQSSNNPILSKKAKNLLNQNSSNSEMQLCLTCCCLLCRAFGTKTKRHIKWLGRMTEKHHRRCRLCLRYRNLRAPSGFSACTRGLATSNFCAGSHLVPKKNWSRKCCPEPAAGTVLFVPIYIFKRRCSETEILVLIG